METLEFRQGYFSEPAALSALTDLLRDTFGIDISVQSRLGGPDPSSMPFGYFDRQGRCVANFSAFTMPMVIGGKEVKLAGYQSGAVRPEYRGRGLYRQLMTAAFAWAEKTSHAAGILLTEKPALYESYGFRIVHQFRSLGAPQPPAGATGIGRKLDISNTDDVKLISQLLVQRQPVSQQFAVAHQKEMFLLNAYLDRQVLLTYLPKHETVVAWKHGRDGAFIVLDIVAKEMPSMTDLLDAVGYSGNHIEVHFPTDGLGWQGSKAPCRAECELMMTDKFGEKLPDGLMLSPMAAF
ncbi:GNAT family N-acetyltransferase [Rhizobium sp. C4]|uniref:GNAT family N-acetyltransferase n=1 Tax=Rhizobium sp. C4 TaxID=1349800 RepID=UPI001E58ED0A|nr:GNAT family N-acetyltransferase [Rhizobium sp. C4]MCD2175406.1 GNAT family N-acetyltransferase [Rhizobium sp. C4]